MKHLKEHRLFRVLSFLLAIILVLPPHAVAAENSEIQPYASYYLTSYQAYVYPAGSGEIQVWFSVTADNYMDDLGALSIEIYESKDNSNWTYKETFMHTDYPNMLKENAISHMDCVTYQGVKGRYYKAYVCIWAGKDGGGDTRYYWTSAKKAT